MDTKHTDDREEEQQLASLGYRQDLKRTWSGFSNFAISFSAISILTGCLTTFSQGWNNGGPIAIAIGWPVVSGFILLVGLCLAELASAYPTSGGVYWWAAHLGGPRAGFFAGWLNLIGLLAITASVVYGTATFLNSTLLDFSSDYADFLGGEVLPQQFFWFLAIMLVITVLNGLRSEFQAMLNNISVGWHVAGSLLIVVLLMWLPDTHQSAEWVFTGRINNSGFGDAWYWWLVLPLGFLLTQYTITGYDASAHLAEESHSAHVTAARGIWQSIFYSAIGGYVLLLALLFAATRTEVISSFDPVVNPYGAGSAISILYTALPDWAFRLVLVVAVAGQFFCGMACLTSCSRMLYAFARDGAVPGHRWWSSVNRNRIPFRAVIVSALAGIVMTLPALWKSPRGIPSAFYAVVSIGVIGLYLAFILPVWYRWKAGDSFQAGVWNLGRHYRWIHPVAMAEIAVVCIYFILPFEPAGVPGNEGFTWLAVNYAPILVGLTVTVLIIWWYASVSRWYSGPKRNVE